MTLHDILYILGNLLVLPFWGMMLLLPNWRFSRRAMQSWYPVALLAGLYVAALLASFFASEPIALSFDLAGIARLLGTPQGAATGWLHFLAFDLFVGRWVYLDSRERGLNAALVSPALLFIFLAGPLGLLLYLGARGAQKS